MGLIVSLDFMRMGTGSDHSNGKPPANHAKFKNALGPHHVILRPPANRPSVCVLRPNERGRACHPERSEGSTWGRPQEHGFFTSFRMTTMGVHQQRSEESNLSGAMGPSRPWILRFAQD